MLGEKWRGEGGKVNGWGMFGMSCKHCLEVYHCRRLVLYCVHIPPKLDNCRACCVCVCGSEYNYIPLLKWLWICVWWCCSVSTVEGHLKGSLKRVLEC